MLVYSRSGRDIWRMLGNSRSSGDIWRMLVYSRSSGDIWRMLGNSRSSGEAETSGECLEGEFTKYLNRDSIQLCQYFNESTPDQAVVWLQMITYVIYWIRQYRRMNHYSRMLISHYSRMLVTHACLWLMHVYDSRMFLTNACSLLTHGVSSSVTRIYHGVTI